MFRFKSPWALATCMTVAAGLGMGQTDPSRSGTQSQGQSTQGQSGQSRSGQSQSGSQTGSTGSQDSGSTRHGKRSQGSADRMNTSGGFSSSDRAFVMTAAEGGMKEVQMGQMALEKAQDPAVKSYAQKLVDDHTRANQELTSLMQSKGLDSPDKTAPTKQSNTSDMHMSSMNGTSFDRSWVHYMVQDHQKDVREFQQEAKRAQDPELKAWIEKTIPVLQDHLRQAQQLQSTMKGNSSNSK